MYAFLQGAAGAGDLRQVAVVAASCQGQADLHLRVLDERQGHEEAATDTRTARSAGCCVQALGPIASEDVVGGHTCHVDLKPAAVRVKQ